MLNARLFTAQGLPVPTTEIWVSPEHKIDTFGWEDQREWYLGWIVFKLPAGFHVVATPDAVGPYSVADERALQRTFAHFSRRSGKRIPTLAAVEMYLRAKGANL